MGISIFKHSFIAAASLAGVMACSSVDPTDKVGVSEDAIDIALPAAKEVVVKNGCKLADISQGEQVGKPIVKPGIFQNNGKPAGVDATEQGNANMLGDKASLKCLHGSPGSTGQPLPTDAEIGAMKLPVIDSVCFAASAGANGCSVLAVECAQTGGGDSSKGQVYACTGTVWVSKGTEYCEGTWVGCDGKPLAIPMTVGTLSLTQGGAAPKGDGWASKCPVCTDCVDAPPPSPSPAPTPASTSEDSATVTSSPAWK